MEINDLRAVISLDSTLDVPYTNLTFIGRWINALALKYEYAE
jgi:hypothetical protein